MVRPSPDYKLVKNIWQNNPNSKSTRTLISLHSEPTDPLIPVLFAQLSTHIENSNVYIVHQNAFSWFLKSSNFMTEQVICQRLSKWLMSPDLLLWSITRYHTINCLHKGYLGSIQQQHFWGGLCDWDGSHNSSSSDWSTAELCTRTPLIHAANLWLQSVTRRKFPCELCEGCHRTCSMQIQSGMTENCFYLYSLPIFFWLNLPNLH